mmetsp:Transcript_900/g.1753  ORF Transcript_900/g.1753 Transcript_900/m.1753 type:complete len:145 (-) Transcript_900:104-538(-)
MKLTTTLLVSIVASAASDDSKMIRGGGLVATAADDETHKAAHNVLRSVNFYEAAAQDDFEDIPPNNGHHGHVPFLPTNPCPACATGMFCGTLGLDSYVSPCEVDNTCSQNGFECKQCSSIDGNSDYVGSSVFRCEEHPSFDENA